MVRMRYRDRAEAGRRLGALLAERDLDDPDVLGLPRGGVAVAAEVAAALAAPLDVVVVRKVGVPGHRELAMGAIGEGGVRVVDERVRQFEMVDEEAYDRAEAAERQRVDDRSASYRAVRPRVPLEGRTALLVDDGIATGSTARAAVAVTRAADAARVVLAVPVAPPDAVAELASVADEVVCPIQPERFTAVGYWYDRFDQVEDEDVLALLHTAAEHTG